MNEPMTQEEFPNGFDGLIREQSVPQLIAEGPVLLVTSQMCMSAIRSYRWMKPIGPQRQS